MCDVDSFPTWNCFFFLSTFFSLHFHEIVSLTGTNGWSSANQLFEFGFWLIEFSPREHFEPAQGTAIVRFHSDWSGFQNIFDIFFFFHNFFLLSFALRFTFSMALSACRLFVEFHRLIAHWTRIAHVSWAADELSRELDLELVVEISKNSLIMRILVRIVHTINVIIGLSWDSVSDGERNFAVWEYVKVAEMWGGNIWIWILCNIWLLCDANHKLGDLLLIDWT